MTEANNERETETPPLFVGLIAQADEAGRFAEAIGACPALELRAQAGMAQSDALPGVPWFDDTRVLITQGEVAALVIATSPRVGVEVGELALSHGMPVWRRPPLGRNFAEAIEVARRARTADVVFHVASWWAHVGEDIRWVLGLDAEPELVFSEVHVSAAGPPLESWRSSVAESGGGVLMHDAYAALEALMAIRGLPESVVGAIGRCRRRSSEAPRETEDVAAAILRYEGGGTGLVHVTWDLPPLCQRTVHHGRETSAQYNERAVAALAPDGTLLEEHPLPRQFVEAELARFAGEIRGVGRPEPMETNLGRHLAVSALLEAVYLSSRTEHPEIPRRFFEVQKWPEPMP